MGGTHATLVVDSTAAAIAGRCPDVWHFDLTDAVDEAVLSPREAARADRFRLARDRTRFVVRRTRLRQVLARYTGCAPRDLRFADGPYGKPALVDHPGVCFSASSSGDRAVVAVGSGDLGIDLEQVAPGDDLADVARRFFAPDEVSQLHDHADFYRCWSRKEAYVKAVGQGLSFPLDSFAVEVGDVPEPRLMRSELRPDDVGRARIVDLSSPSGEYMAAVVVLAAGAPAPTEQAERFHRDL